MTICAWIMWCGLKDETCGLVSGHVGAVPVPNLTGQFSRFIDASWKGTLAVLGLRDAINVRGLPDGRAA